ncbi:hypothetical protein WUBG_14413 [Wuchereria bancrofti]|uniref:Uncharacterized protein n=1 Tax=Wuchereria bancrofti TaxID=6293 RepID=J9AKE4_WUCBA|nr:hypothetical protein WUBG_14413 [Wuchereria bancrofti]
MSKLIVHLVFIIYCFNQQPNAGGGGAGAAAGGVAPGGVAAEVVTDYKADKLWDNNLLMETTQVEGSTLTNCDTMENGRLFILAEKPLLLTTNTLNLIK